MTRRSTPQKNLDDRRFPLVAYFRVPEGGMSGARVDPHHWLQKNVGAGMYAYHAAGRPSGDVFAVYFRRLVDLQAFIEAHKALDLADDVEG